MEEPLCQIEIVQDGTIIIAKIKSELGERKFTSPTLEGVLEQLVSEIQDEFESL